MYKKIPILDIYFCQKMTLHDYIKNLGLPIPEDSRCKTLVNKIIISTTHDGDLFCNISSLGMVYYNTSDLLHRAIEYLCSVNQSNILSRGYTFIREGSKKSTINGFRLQIVYHNSLVVYLNQRSWVDIHSILGDDLMFYLLTKTWLLLKVHSNCYIQLCGKPVTDLSVRTCSNTCEYLHLFASIKDVKKDHCVSNGSFGNESRIKRKLENRYPANKRRKVEINKPNVKSKHVESKLTFLQPLEFNIKVSHHENQIINQQSNGLVKPTIKKRQIDYKSAPINYIHRNKMFYSKILKESLSQKHILNIVQPSNNGICQLLNHIFKLSSKKIKGVKRIPKQLLPLKDLMKAFLRKFKKLNIKKLLCHFCSSSTSRFKKTTSRSSFVSRLRYKLAANSFTPPIKVFLLLRTILLKTIPELLWGCSRNKKNFLKWIFNIVLLGRYERITVDQIMTNVRFASYNWLFVDQGRTPSVQQSLKIRTFITTFYVWLINSFFIPIVRGYFYVTETGCHKQKVFYYRKSVWKVMREEGLKLFLRDVYQPIKEKKVKEMMKNGNCVGVHSVRLIPSAKKIRPVANMNSCYGGENLDKKVLVNQQLRNLHTALQHEANKNRSILGASVRTPIDIFHKISSFKSLVKTKYAEVIPSLFFVSVDICRCYDMLPQKQIVTYIPNVLKDQSYLFRAFIKVKSDQNGNVRRKTCRVATAGTNCDNFIDFISRLLCSGQLVGQNTIFVDTVYVQEESRSELLMKLKRHIFYSIGKIDQRYVLQKAGVAQGSILATILNNLHYGKVENKYLKDFMTSPECVLMRWVDDYLLITTAKSSAVSFINKVKYGMPKFGCEMNLKKSLLNFPYNLDGFKYTKISGKWLPWCGYLINTETLEFTHNYVQYIGDHLKDHMTIHCGSSPGDSLQRKLLQAISVKASTIIVDSAVNSTDNLHKNIYQLFRFIALKFHVHCKAGFRGKEFTRRIKFFKRLIKNFPSAFIRSCDRNYCKTLYQSQHGHTQSAVSLSSFSRKTTVDKDTVTFLCFQAFIDTLRSKQTRYKQLITMLATKLKYLNDVSMHINVERLRQQSKVFSLIKC